jgi:hypothetical protein
MSDYTAVGIDKIIQQAKTDPSLIRCPRDRAVMRVLCCHARQRNAEGAPPVVANRLPRTTGWIVTELDVECPACRRRAESVKVAS